MPETEPREKTRHGKEPARLETAASGARQSGATGRDGGWAGVQGSNDDLFFFDLQRRLGGRSDELDSSLKYLEKCARVPGKSVIVTVTRAAQPHSYVQYSTVA